MRQIIVVCALAFAAVLTGCGTVQKRVAAPIPEPALKGAPTTAADSVVTPLNAAVQAKPTPTPPAPASAPTPKSPEQMASLQPFIEFKKGAGEGVAYRYVKRSKGQFVALLRDKKLAKKEMRVTCEKLVQQMAEARGLPFEGCEGAATAIESDSAFAVAACTDDMFMRDNWLAVTNEKGTKFGAWHRKCLPGEQVLLYKGEPVISLTCLNVVVPLKPAVQPVQRAELNPPAPIAPAVPAVCSGNKLVAFGWDPAKLKPEFKEEMMSLIGLAKGRDSEFGTLLQAYEGNALSRTMGDRLLQSRSPRAEVTASIVVNYLDPRTGEVVQNLGTLRMVNGRGEKVLPGQPWHYIVETLWPANTFISPTVSGADEPEKMGRLLLFPSEWRKREPCYNKYVHGAIPVQ